MDIWWCRGFNSFTNETFMDLLDVPSNIYINIIIFIILVFSVISIRIYLRKNGI